MADQEQLRAPRREDLGAVCGSGPVVEDSWGCHFVPPRMMRGETNTHTLNRKTSEKPNIH